MDTALAWLLRVVVVVALSGSLTFAIRRPRLRLEVSLRGTTRTGRLYIVLTNAGGIAASNARVRVEWLAPDGRRALVDEQQVGEVPARDALRLDVRNLHRGKEGGGIEGEGFTALQVTARAAWALPARARLDVARAVAAQDEAPVRYEARLRCPVAAEGAHAFEERRIHNDGVTETWNLCRLCRHVERLPLSPADQEIQKRIRAERAERERRDVEREFARIAAQETPHQREPPRRWWRDAARDEDTLPPDVAFYVLELDAVSATWEDVLTAHRRLALAHHPDRDPSAPAEMRAERERKMQEINAARDRLRVHFGMRAGAE
ncbi:MAG TPA: J domain-containing protein [Candidatus Thermoplasmatota archaeon]|nr:J domain-containing protein [Candidatus Thermoplasmatota archaeon]